MTTATREIWMVILPDGSEQRLIYMTDLGARRAIALAIAASGRQGAGDVQVTGQTYKWYVDVQDSPPLRGKRSPAEHSSLGYDDPDVHEWL